MRKVIRWKNDRAMAHEALRILDLSKKSNVEQNTFKNIVPLENLDIELKIFQTKYGRGVELKKIFAKAITAKDSLQPHKLLELGRVVTAQQRWNQESVKEIMDVSTKYAIIINQMPDKVAVEYGLYEIREYTVMEDEDLIYQRTEAVIVHPIENKVLKNADDVNEYVNRLRLKKIKELFKGEDSLIEMLSVEDDTPTVIAMANEKLKSENKNPHYSQNETSTDIRH